MLKKLAHIISLLVFVPTAHAAPGEVVFRGVINVTNTVGCDGWNPKFEQFDGIYFVPVTGSTNGTDSTLILNQFNLGVEAYSLSGDVFTSSYKNVQGVHSFTRAGTYSAKVKVTARVPSVLSTTTPSVKVVGKILGFGGDANCEITFSMQGMRILNP